MEFIDLYGLQSQRVPKEEKQCFNGSEGGSRLRIEKVKKSEESKDPLASDVEHGNMLISCTFI